MTTLWTGEHEPPQLSEEAKSRFVGDITQQGIVAATFDERLAFTNSDNPLGIYLDQLGMIVNVNDNSAWPDQAIKIGAACAIFAYRKDGLSLDFDADQVGISVALAEMEGVPEAYVTSLYADVALSSVIRLVGERAMSKFDAKSPSRYSPFKRLEGSIGLGAGFVRYHIRNTLMSGEQS
jgi:hypothetical protein